MNSFLRRIGISETFAAVLMVAVGVLVLIFPELMTRFIGVYLVIVGVVKLVSKTD